MLLYYSLGDLQAALQAWATLLRDYLPVIKCHRVYTDKQNQLARF